LAARKAEEAEEEREYMDLMLKYGMDFGFEWWDTERCQKEVIIVIIFFDLLSF